MTGRTYQIDVPYTTTGRDGLAISMGLNLPQVHAALARLDPALVAKLQRCSLFHSETFSRDELDSIPEDIWDAVAPYIG